MDEALAHNADLEAAAARVREARASLRMINADALPRVELQIDHTQSQRSTASATPVPPGVERRSADHSVSLAASYELDLWGRLAAGTAAARQQLRASEWAQTAVAWSLTAQVAETYFNLAAIDRQLLINTAVLASRKQTLEMRQRQLSVGTGDEFELRRAEAEVTAAEATTVSLARQRAAQERALLLLLGRAPHELARALPITALDETRIPELKLPQDAAAALLTRRPDVREAEANLAAANADIDAARAATLPSVRLTGAIGSDARQLANLFSGPAALWSLGANIAQAVFDGGRNRARVDQQTARAEQALAHYRKIVASAVLDLREAYTALDLAQSGLHVETARAAALQRAYALATQGVTHGALAPLDLLDTERNWQQARLQQVTAARDRLIGQVSVYRALGSHPG